MKKMYAEHVATITAQRARRQLWELTPEIAEKAIRAARRQVQRYGDEARTGLLSWCESDESAAAMERALNTSVRVGTVVKEWDERTKA